MDGHVFGRTIERDGRPLSEGERKQEEESIQKRLAEIRTAPPTPTTVKKRQTKDEDAWIGEFPEALDYQKAGEELLAGRKAIVLDATSRPGYKASKLARSASTQGCV